MPDRDGVAARPPPRPAGHHRRPGGPPYIDRLSPRWVVVPRIGRAVPMPPGGQEANGDGRAAVT